MTSTRSNKADSGPALEQPKTPGAVRAPLATLVGVAPPAPIVSGRPPSSSAFPGAEAHDTIPAPPVDGLEVPESQVRRRTPQASPVPSELAAPPPPAPKHTLDAISVGEAHAPAEHRWSRVVWLVALVAAIALAAFATRNHWKNMVHRPASIDVAPQAVAATQPLPAVAPPATDALATTAVAPTAPAPAARQPSQASPVKKPAPKAKLAPKKHRAHST